MNQKELQLMFGSTPDSFQRRVQYAATHAAQSAPARRVRPRVLVLAAVLVVLLGTVAYAASTGWRLFDFWTSHSNVGVPQAAQDALEQTPQKTYTVGKVNVTLQEAIADGSLVYVSSLARPVEGKAVLLWLGNGDANEPMQPPTAEAYGMPAFTTYLEAARQLGLPLYGVEVTPEADDYWVEWEMADIMDQRDGGMMLVNQIAMTTEEPELTLGYRVLFCELDSVTGERIEDTEVWVRDTFTVPVQPTLAVRRFTAADDSITDGRVHVQSVRLEQKATGAYVTWTLSANEGVAPDGLRDSVWDAFQLTDAQGDPIPGGISMSGDYNDSGFPTIVMSEMLGVGELPSELHVSIIQYGEGGRTVLATYPLTQYADEEVESE